MKTMEQCVNKIPDDLVCLPETDILSIEDLKRVAKANWYDVYISMDPDNLDDLTVFLMVSGKEIRWVSWGSFEGGISLDELGGIVKEIVEVDNVLKRWDGGRFYHA